MRKIDLLVIHHSASSRKIYQDINTIRKEHKMRGYIDIGYHKVIYPNGEIHQGRPDAMNGAHCYSKYYKNSWGVNRRSLGICVIGNFEIEKPTAEQLESLIKACVILCKRHNINPKNIKGHRDFMATACPGKNLYSLLPDIIKEVEKKLKEE